MEVTIKAKVNMPNGEIKEVDVVIWEVQGELQIRTASPDEI